MTANDQLQESAIAHAVDLRAYSDSAVRQMLTILNRSEVALMVELRAVLDRMSPDSFTVQRLESQLGTVRQTIAASYERLSGQLSLEMEDFARYETAWQATTMEAALPAVINVATVAPAQVYAAAMARPFQGALLSQWITTLDTDTATRVRRSIVQGFSESKTTDQIIRDIRGTKARGYKDGVLEISRREAEAVVRTALSHTAAVAGEQFETRNADIIKQVRWLSTLDARTSPPCRLRDNLLYEAGTHKPVGHSYPWGAGPGQFHWRCRSTRTFVTKGWKEYGIDSFTPAERASMDGQVPATMDYQTWLRKQPAARQNEVLGVERGKLFRSGDLTLDQMYSARGVPLTLEQLRKKL